MAGPVLDQGFEKLVLGSRWLVCSPTSSWTVALAPFYSHWYFLVEVLMRPSSNENHLMMRIFHYFCGHTKENLVKIPAIFYLELHFCFVESTAYFLARYSCWTRLDRWANFVATPPGSTTGNSFSLSNLYSEASFHDSRTLHVRFSELAKANRSGQRPSYFPLLADRFLE